MLVNTLIPLFVIFAYPQSKATKDAENRSMNIALETILEFGNNHRTVDQFFDNLANFIKNVKKITVPDDVSRRKFRSTRVDSFTGFVQELIAILNTYKGNDFQDFIEIFGHELRKYHYRGCKFHELIENYDIRQFVNKKLHDLRYIPVAEVKSKLNLFRLILNKQLHDKRFKDLIDYINSLYIYDSQDKFTKVLNNMYVYKKSKTKRHTDDLVDIVRDGIRAIIFDHYTRLNHSARRELKHKIETLWKHHKISHTSFPAINASDVENKPRFDKVELDKDVKHSKPKHKKTELRDAEREYELERINLTHIPKTSTKKIKQHNDNKSNRHKIKQIKSKSDNVYSKVPRVPKPKKTKHTTPKHSLEILKENDKREHLFRESHESNSAVIAERESQHKYISLYPEPFITTNTEKIKIQRKFPSRLRSRHGVRHRNKKTHKHHHSEYKPKHRNIELEHASDTKVLSASASHDNKDVSQDKHESRQ